MPGRGQRDQVGDDQRRREEQRRAAPVRHADPGEGDQEEDAVAVGIGAAEVVVERDDDEGH